MAYNEKLADRTREVLADELEKSRKKVDEKRMMGGLTFMVNDKMCVGIHEEDLMCRIAPEDYEDALEQQGCRMMNFTGREMKGFVFIDETGTKDKRTLRKWVKLALAYNDRAKSSKKKKK